MRRPDDLASMLLELKQRSALSYAQLARRTFTSSSTLHRYCTGTSVPADYQTVVRLGEECGASDDELNELLRRWRNQEHEAVQRGAEAVPAEPVEEPVPLGALRSRRGLRPGHAWLPVAALAVAAVLAAVTIASVPPPEQQEEVPPQQRSLPDPDAVPAWVRHPAPVEPEMFGVTMNSHSGEMPAFRVGSVRLWDSNTRWAGLEPARGRYDWSTLDRMVGAAQEEDLPVTFVLGGTPEWAAPDAPSGTYSDGSRSAPPDDLADWDGFVRRLVERFQGRIDAYELWNSATDEVVYSGSPRTLVEMTRRAADIVHEVDPRATVVCPSMGELWSGHGMQRLREFADLGGYEECDAVGIKLHPRSAADPPESALELLPRVSRTLHERGIVRKLWNTGTRRTLPNEEQLDEPRAVAHAMRFYLSAFYARPFEVERMYFYSWGTPTNPVVLQAEGSPPTAAGLAVERLQSWLAGTAARGCGRGLDRGLPEGVWECEFVDGAGQVLQVRWSPGERQQETRAGHGAQYVTDVRGVRTAVGPGDPVPVSGTPVLLTSTR
nr:helix-turn-helix domain-containing protein [Saccharopolyspora sp. HNM0983]